MRVLPVALAALLALAGLAAAAAGAGAGNLRTVGAAGTRGRALLADEDSSITVPTLSSGASTISLTVQQRKPATTLGYAVLAYNNLTKTWPNIGDAVEVTAVSPNTQTPDVPTTDYVTHTVTLNNLSPGYYRVVVTVIITGRGEFPFDFPAGSDAGVAVGSPGPIAIDGVANVAGQNKFRVTFTGSAPVTAGKYRYKAYPFGTAHALVEPSAFEAITPWVNATTVFPTVDLNPGLYSVWVEAQHTYDSSLAVTATTSLSTSYAIGTANPPEIVRADEPVEATGANKFVVFFKYPATNNVQQIGYSLEDVNSPSLPVTATCGASECTKVGTKYLATVLDAGSGAPSGATHKLETGVVAKGLYKIKLWGINAPTPDGTASVASSPVATFDTPGQPTAVTAAQNQDRSSSLTVQFSRATDKIGSAYFYDVKDAKGVDVPGMTNLKASIADVTQDSLTFTTAVISSANQRYSVVVRACTGLGTKCSPGGSSNLAGVVQPSAPRNVQIAAGLQTLTITWDAPTTDTATSYTVKVYKDASAFSTMAQSWTGLAWNNNPALPAGQGQLVYQSSGQPSYSFTTPTLTLDPGYYRAEVLAVHSPFNDISENSGTSRAALGNPGAITVVAVAQEALSERIRITFKEEEPKTGESYWVTVQTRATNTGSPTDVNDWIRISRTATVRADGNKDILISTAASGQPAWPGPGRYFFIVSATNAAGGDGVSSPVSSELLVGPPGIPTGEAPDTTDKQITTTITPGTPTLDETYRVRIFKLDGSTWPLSCPESGWAQQLNYPLNTLVGTSTTLTDEKGIYCVRVGAVFRSAFYLQPTPIVPVFVGTPEVPNTPTLESGKTSFTVKFTCPTVWNSRNMTYELKRVDVTPNVVVQFADLAAATNPSPKLVRSDGSTALPAGQKRIVETLDGTTRVCTFTIPSSEIPNAGSATSNVGRYKIQLKAHNDAASSSFSVESSEAWLGEPDVPAGVTVPNNKTAEMKVTIQMDKPAADVHGGFVLWLKWLRGGVETDATSSTSGDGTSLFIDRTDATNVDTSGASWKISFPIASMLCGGAACAGEKGRFKVVAFGALSRFDAANANFQTDYKKGRQVMVADADLPSGDIFYGNPEVPTGLTIVNTDRRIYGPSGTNTLDLQVDVPAADVAKEYKVELYYYPIQTYDASRVTLSRTVQRSDLPTTTVGSTQVYTLAIDLTQLDCDPDATNTKACGAGSYRVKCFTAVSWVTEAGSQSVAEETLDTLASAASGGDVIVEATGGTLEVAKAVHIPNVPLAATPGDTLISIELDVPATDNIMGWEVKLDYVPGTSRTPYAVQDGSGGTAFFLPRLATGVAVIESGARLRIPLKKLSELKCTTDGTNYAACPNGGRFQLTSLTAYSWFSTDGTAIAKASYTLASPATQYTRKQGTFGSPSTAEATWDGDFFLGSPVAPTNIREPGVLDSDSPLDIFTDAPALDNAFSYSVTMERLPDGATADDGGTSITVVVYRDAVTLVTTGANQGYKLSIPSTTLGKALTDAGASGVVDGRYRLTALAAVSWFDVQETPDRAPATFTPIRFVIGEPGGPTNVEVTNTETLDTYITIQMDAPAGDVHGGFVLQLNWLHGGQKTPVQSNVPGDGDTIFAQYSDADRASVSGKWKITFPFSGMLCGSNACTDGRYEIVKFGTLSLFDDSGALVTADYTTGKKVWADSPPTDSIFYGNPEEPQGLSIVSRRIYNPTATKLELQIDIPERDVAKEYEVKLYYYSVQKYDTSRADLTKPIPRFSPAVNEAGGKLTLSIDLSQFDCASSKCGAGSYRVASFKAVSRATIGNVDAPVTDLSSLTNGGDIIVEDLGGTPAAPQQVFIPNQLYDSIDPAKTLISIELDVPAKDNIMGWECELWFEPGAGDSRFTNTAVKDSTGTTTTLFVPRLSATYTAADGRLAFTVKLGDLQCLGGFFYGPCSGGKFSLKSIKALSWFTTASPPAGISTAGSSNTVTRATAAFNDAYTKKSDVIFGSPPIEAASTWDGVFYIGTPDAPSIESVPPVTLTTSDLVIFLNAKLEDNVFSYKVTLERLPAGAADGQGTSVTLELYRGQAVSPDPQDTGRVQLAITSSALRAKLTAAGATGTNVVAGRYRLYELKAVSWFAGEPEVPTGSEPVYVIIGSPSESSLVLNGAPSVRTGTLVEVTIDKPDADVASVYTVDVSYYSGKADTAKPLQAVATCSTSAKDLLGGGSAAADTRFVVRCPAGCTDKTAAEVYTSNSGETYLYTSSICRAAIRYSNVDGGLVMLKLVAGDDLAGRDFRADTADINGVTPSVPTGPTAADNWDIRFETFQAYAGAESPLPDTTTTFVVPRVGGTRVQGSNLVLPINLLQGDCLASAACTAGKFLVTGVTAHPWHTTGYGADYEKGVSGTKSAGALLDFTYLGDPEIPTGVVAANSDDTVDSFTISFDRPESDTAKEYYVEVNEYFPGGLTTDGQKCSGTFDMPDTTGQMTAKGYTDASTKRTFVLTSTMMGGSCSLAPGKFRVTTFKAVSRFNDQTNNYDKSAEADTLKVNQASSYFYVGPVGDVTSVTSPDIPIAEATPSNVNSLVVEWEQTSPDAAKTASYRLFRQPVGAESQEQVCGRSDLSQSDLDGVRFKAGASQPLTLTVGLCPVAIPLMKGRYQLEWTVNGQPSSNTPSLTSPFFYIGDPTPPGKPALTNNIASSRLDVEFSTPTTDNAEYYKYDLVQVKDAYVTVPADAATDDANGNYWFVQDHKAQTLPDNKVLGTSTNTFHLTGLGKGLYRVRVTSVNPNKDGAPSPWSEVIGTGSPEAPVITAVPNVETGSTLTVKLNPPTDDTALFYTVEVDYYSGLQTGPKTLPTFTVMRWGTSGSFASFEGTGEDRKLVLPVDVSQVDCRTGGTAAENQCGDGKYVVKSVTAHRWVSGGSESSNTDVVATSTPIRTAFTFVGKPVAPAGIRVPHVVQPTSDLEIFITATDKDNAQSIVASLERLPAGIADGSGTQVELEVQRGVSGQFILETDEFKLPITSASLLAALKAKLGNSAVVAGRYRLHGIKATSWFSTEHVTTPFTPIHFIIGSPSDLNTLEIEQAPNKLQGTLDVSIAAPDVDVAKYYLVGVSYFIGTAAKPLQTDALSCATTAKAALASQTLAAGSTLVVNCPAGCATTTANKVFTSTAGEYLFTSSVCRAAIHAGVLEDAGGPVQLVLKAGAGTTRAWTVDTTDVHGVRAEDAGTIDAADNWDMTLEALSPAPVTTSFIVPRWGGTGGLVARVESSMLVLPVDLSQAVCRQDSNSVDVRCGDGKYLVTSVTALPWHDSSSYTPPATGAKASSAYGLYTFIGNPETPAVVSGISTTTLNKLSIQFTRPKADGASEYQVKVTKFFPGSLEVDTTCDGTVDMPDAPGDPTLFVDDSSADTRTIEVACALTPGKFKVSKLTAVTQQTGGTNQDADLSAAAYFYVGTVNEITKVSSPDITEADANAPAGVTTLLVQWEQSSADAAKEASYTLWRYPNEATSDATKKEAICTAEPVLATTMDTVRYQGSDKTKLQVTVDVCGGKSLAKGRYIIEWTVKGDPASNQQSKTSAYFYIGDPVAPTKPALTNNIVASPNQLDVEFSTPTTDNAASYTYDLVKVANPSITVLDTAVPSDGSATTFQFVTGHTDVAIPGAATLGATSNTFYLTGLDDGLYRLRVKSVNPLKPAGVASVWSDIIGTGPISGKSPNSVTVVDGEDKLTVTFQLVEGALGYRYTVFKEDYTGAINVLTNHLDVEIKSPAITTVTWDGSTQATFDIVDGTPALPDGRYTVAIAPKNTDATGTVEWGAYTRAKTRAAVGTPGPPQNVVLANTIENGSPKVGSVTVTFDAPSPDSGLEYWYALYRADTDQECYTSLGTKVTDDLLTASTKTFVVNSLDSGDYKVRVGVKNGLTSSTEEGKLCTDKNTAVQLNNQVVWSALSPDGSDAAITVDNPDKPGKPTVVYNHGANLLTVTFDAPATTRKYTYQVTKGSGGTQVTAGTVTNPFTATNPGQPEPFTISTSGWEPDSYQVTVYVQNAFTTGSGIDSDPSDKVFVGTPDPVTDIKLENTVTDGTITVKYTPPSVDIAQDGPKGSYRYTVLARDANYAWQELPGSISININKPDFVSGSTTQRSFPIAGLAPGLYQVKVWGVITHDNGKDGSGNAQTIDVTSDVVTSTGDHSDASKKYMRDGTIAVGAPGVPQLELAGAEGGMTIKITSVTGNDNALSYKWVYLKDGDTLNTDVGSQLAKAIPLTAATQTSDTNGFIDPLTVKGQYPVSYTVPLNAQLCGANRDQACDEGTYRVGIIAVNGFAESTYKLTDTADSSIMGLPATPTVSSLVVQAETMETLVATWQISNKWTALRYTYSLRNAVGTDTYTDTLLYAGASGDDQSFSKTVTPTAGGSYTGSGVYYVEVTAANDNGASTSDEAPDTGRVVGIPIAGDPLGLRGVSVADPTTRQLTISFLDGWNPWVVADGGCETTYEWEVLRSPGLSLVASSSGTIDPCKPSNGVLCTRTGDSATWGCSNVVTDVAGTGLADGRYQVVIVAYNQYGYKRSAASNIVTVGAPSSTPLVLNVRDGDSKLSVSFPTPERPGSYQCQATGADSTAWPAAVTKSMYQVSVSDDGRTTSFDITSTDVELLGSNKQRWAVQCKPINSWSSSVGWSAPVTAASGAPSAVGAPTLALPTEGNGVKFTFTPAGPDAAMRYVFILEGQNGSVWESPAVAFDSTDLKPAAGGAKEYTWSTAPSGQYIGKVRTINGVGNATSPASTALALGLPGTPGTPDVQNGQTGFLVSFNPGAPSTATEFYYNIYTEDGTLVNTGGKVPAPTPTTPSGGYNYNGLTPADLLSFDTGNLATMAGVNLQAGVYQITMFAFNGGAPSTPTDLQYSPESAKSNLVSLGKPGIPTGLTVANSLRKIAVQFTKPSPDAAVYYEYTVRDANKANVPGATRIRVERSALTPAAGGKLSFETVPLNTYQLYSIRLTAVGYGSVFSSWSGTALAGMPSPVPSSVTLTPGATRLTVTFSSPALSADTSDTFAYKLYSLGATPVAVGDANGYVVPRNQITGTLTADGSKSFDIALDTSGTPDYALLKAPAGGYYVEVLTARVLADGSKELSAASSQAGPATLGAPKTPATKPDVKTVTSGADPTATIEWAYDSYSTYTKVAWRLKKASDATAVVASGSRDITRSIASAVSLPVTETVPLKYTSGASSGQALQGRFTVEVCMANAQVDCDATSDDRWSPASDAFAAGAPTAPTSVTITNDHTKTPTLSGAFTLPADPTYDALSYRLVNVNEDGTDGAALFSGWKDLTAAEISAGAFDIPDSVDVGGTSVAVPTGRYRLDMRAATNNGASPADYIGSAATPAAQTPALKGTPVAVTGVSATSGATSIELSFQGAAFATSYSAHVLDSNGAPVLSGSVALTVSGGTGPKTESLSLAQLGNPSGAATFKFKIDSRNPNVAVTGDLSGETSLAIVGQLATPAAPELEWFNQAGSDPAHAELRFQAIDSPAGASPIYEYQLYNATSGLAVGSWQTIDLAGNSGDGSSGNKYKVRLAPSPGKYTATLRAKTALGASATSAESGPSPAEVMGFTSEPSIGSIALGTAPQPDIVTEDDGATTVTLRITLPSNNSGTTDPKLQLRMDTVEPAAATGAWATVASACADASTALCIEGGLGTSADPQRVRVKLSVADLPSPRRVKFVARTENDNGPGTESAPSATISVGRPKAPAVTTAGSASGVEVSFTPDTPLSDDTFRYWAVDASPGSTGKTVLLEADVGAVTTGPGGVRKFTVPFADFEGNNVPYIVTVKMAAVNANGKRSPDASASEPATVGPATAPTGVSATAVINGNSATVAVSYTPGDTTAIANRYKIRAYPESDRLVVLNFDADTATSTTAQQSTTLTVGGGVGQLPPGRWRFSVVAENANSKAESAAFPASGWVSAGIPGAPVITAVSGTQAGVATISYTVAADNTADKVRIYYSDGALGWTPTPTLLSVDPAAAVKTASLSVGDANGLPRSGNWRFKLETVNNAGGAPDYTPSPESNWWPATTVGVPGAPTINTFAGSLDAITLTVTQAADKTATAFVLKVHDASSGNEISDYTAPLLSTSAPDGNGRQKVVFATDKAASRLGGSYKFQVAAINSLGTGDYSDLTATAVAAYKPATPADLVAAGRTDRATLTFLPTAGAVSFEAAILPANSDWRVATDALAPFAPASVQPVDVSGTAKLTFDVPLSAFAYRDGQYTLKVRALDANGVPGDWSDASAAVSIGVPDMPTALTVTPKLDSSAVDLSFVPAWLAEQGYEIEVLSQDGNTVLDTLTVAASSCVVKAAAPQ